MSSKTDFKPERIQRKTGLWSTKNIAFIAIMGALGNILSWLSMSLTSLPQIPLGPITLSLALDLSHLTTFITALYGGPLVGGITGLIGGAVAANVFGFSQGNLLTGFALPIGKALTGITAGFVMRPFNIKNRHQALIVVSTVLSYIPEGIFTAFIFLIVFPMIFGPAGFLYAFVASLLVKAFIEMFVMGVILAAFSVNKSFRSFMNGFFKSS
jgi:hypothetical protein